MYLFSQTERFQITVERKSAFYLCKVKLNKEISIVHYVSVTILVQDTSQRRKQTIARKQLHAYFVF